jgi:phosphoribosylamine-glycine ligase
MNIAVIGSGGREHSICFKLKQSKQTNKIFVFQEMLEQVQ